MRGLRRTDAQEDAQDFYVTYTLRESGIKATASLLDKSKVETSRERDGLGVEAHAARLTGVGHQILITSRDGRVLVNSKRRDGIVELEVRVEVWVSLSLR